MVKYQGDQKKLEKQLLKEVDRAALWEHVEKLCAIGEKFAGTPEEKQTIDYIVSELEREGVPVEVHEIDAYVSWPSHDRSKDADLTVTSPKKLRINCQSHAMSGSTEGLEAEIVDMGPGDLKDYEGKDVRGKIVLVDFAALWAPERLYIAQEKGAVGQITVSGDPVIHDMVCTSVWGTPTAESAKRIPRIPIVSITRDDGAKLREAVKKGGVKAKLRVNIWKGWRKILLPVATIPGAVEPEKYFLDHGHHCSWGDGMTDNVGGNAHFIEMAKILWRNKGGLRRTVKFAWWPGHSHGRYAGSTWFVDNNWEDLYRNCVGQMNDDSPGVIGATEWFSNSSSDLAAFNKANMAEFEKALIKEPILTTHNTLIYRAADYSFFGIGIARLGCNTNIPADSPLKGKTTGGGAGGWWWHTLQDTIDKGDKELLARSMELNLLNITRLANAVILPYGFEPVADDYLKALAALQEAANGTFNFKPLIEKAGEVKKTLATLEKHRTAAEKRNLTEEETKRLNDGLLKISRILNGSFCNEAGMFEQDPAVRIPPLPRLDRVRELAKMDQESDEAKFLKTTITRERNRIMHALVESQEIAEGLLK